MKDPQRLTEQIARKIEELRKDRGFTQKGFCNKTGIPYKAYQSWEERRARPRYEMLIQLAEFYQISLDNFLTFDKAIKTS